MYNVVTSFGNYPSNIKLGEPGPYTAEELGLKWLKHCALFSDKEMLRKYRLVLLLPREIKIPDSHTQYLQAWGEKLRFDENSRVQDWPLGPNLVFQQVLWLYHYKKLHGPFLWCEPDCIPIKPRWLDDLFDEYAIKGKPFMGALVEQKSENGRHIPKHLTGNAIYPEDTHKHATMALQARLTPWDVYAAKQIMPLAHFTTLIQHEYRHSEIATEAQMLHTLAPGAVLFHTDKFGALIRLLGGEHVVERHEAVVLEKEKDDVVGQRALVDVLPQPNREMPLDEMLGVISAMCRLSQETRKKVAYYMLESGIVNKGHVTVYLRRQKSLKIEPSAVQPPA